MKDYMTTWQVFQLDGDAKPLDFHLRTPIKHGVTSPSPANNKAEAWENALYELANFSARMPTQWELCTNLTHSRIYVIDPTTKTYLQAEMFERIEK